MTEREESEQEFLEAKKRKPLILSGDPWPEDPALCSEKAQDDVFHEEVADEGHAIVIVPAETWRRARQEKERTIERD